MESETTGTARNRQPRFFKHKAKVKLYPAEESERIYLDISCYQGAQPDIMATGIMALREAHARSARPPAEKRARTSVVCRLHPAMVFLPGEEGAIQSLHHQMVMHPGIRPDELYEFVPEVDA